MGSSAGVLRKPDDSLYLENRGRISRYPCILVRKLIVARPEEFLYVSRAHSMAELMFFPARSSSRSHSLYRSLGSWVAISAKL